MRAAGASAREALEFYHSVLGGSLNMSTFKEFNAAQDPAEEDLIMHGQIEGDHGVVMPGWGDGTCRHCQIGNTHICPNVRWPGFGPYGGFAEFIPVPARYLIKVDSRLKFEELAPLTDAGLTPYRGVKKLRDAGALGPNRVLGVFGVGGLGGYAVQYAKLLGGGATIVAFDRNPDNLAVAKEDGADHIISIKGKASADVAKELSKAAGQSDLDAIIDCAGARR